VPTTIRVACPSCGDQTLPPAELTLAVCSDAYDLVAEGTSYRFWCPGCGQRVTRAADAKVACLLAAHVELVEPEGFEAGIQALLED
jgi:predicted RNA-binding Zn-ribbon protein involved in translation (DUF1610 family)